MDQVRIYYHRENDDLFAVIENAPANKGRKLCYSIVGQHSEASIEYIKECEPVEITDQKAVRLVSELRQIGYEF